MKFSKTKFVHAALFFSVALLSACGGGGGGGGGTTPAPTPAPTPASSTYSIGGTTSGLSGSVVLQNNLGDNLTVTANGAFTFATKINSGSAYSVSVLTQPSGQTCSVSTGAGTASGSNVTNVAVVCSVNTYNVGGSVSGLSGSVVLQDNNGDNLTVTANGAFTFATKVANGSAYSVTVLTQPSATQSCSVANGTGNIALNAVSNISITCATNTYAVGGNVSLLKGSMVLQNNGADNLNVAVNGAFNFPTAVSYGNSYNVSVLTQPSNQKCLVANGAGSVTGAVSNVGIACASQLGGAMQGLALNLVPTVSTLAGATPGADGVGVEARFATPNSVVSDGVNLYVADMNNHKIRKIVIATGAVSTLAGTGAQGATDGAGTVAKFNLPTGITTDGINLYVTDRLSNKIRQIVIATGVVSSLTGVANTVGAAGATDGAATAATFNWPYGITTDGTNLYVAEWNNHKIRKIVIATGAVSTFAGTGVFGAADGAGSTATFNRPTGITTDNTNLYVVDTFNHKIRQIVIATGVVSTLAGTGVFGAADGAGTTATFDTPYGITTDGTNLFVADMANQKIRKVVITTGVVSSLTGVASTASIQGTADGAGSVAKFNNPQGITVFGSVLYVADANNSTIRTVSVSTAAVATLAGHAATASDGIGGAASFNTPNGITSDGSNLYVADTWNNKIRKIVIATGAVSTLAGTGALGAFDGAGTSATFNGPYGITTDGTNLFVTDWSNSAIRKIVIATGVVSTLAGGALGVTDGIGASALFNGPSGITTDGINLYVADFGNNKIRKIVIATAAVSSLTGGASAAVVSGAVDGSNLTASFNMPSGITTDGVNLYVADSGNNKIRQIVISSGAVSSMTGTANTVMVASMSDGAGINAAFKSPQDITCDGLNLYVTDALNQKIRKIVLATGMVSSLNGAANIASSAGSTDGVGATATFNTPYGITSDGVSLYVTDSGNNTIRKIQ